MLPESRFDMVRTGITLSGYLPAPHMTGKVSLRRAVTLRTRLARVYGANVGDTVGYGRTWSANKQTRIGLIPLGYGDGLRRALSNKGEVLVRGRRCPIVGRVSMDQAGVDVSDVPGANEGDEVVIIGRQGDDEITADDLARQVGTISYEILCGLSERVPRHYILNGEPVEVCNLLGCIPTRET
jgi:alanine racemase